MEETVLPVDRELSGLIDIRTIAFIVIAGESGDSLSNPRKATIRIDENLWAAGSANGDRADRRPDAPAFIDHSQCDDVGPGCAVHV